MTISMNEGQEPAQSTPCSKKHAVIIFDWDDTLMASSWVDREKLIQVESFAVLPFAMQRMFEKLEQHVEKCLRAATELGTVIVITNAEAGWVEYSSKRFMPRLIPLLSETRIVSARSTYERYYPGSPLCWKAAAFAHEANVVFRDIDYGDDASQSSLGRQIISFGDSNEERTAVKIAAGQLGALAKSIKFVDLPNPEQLCKQIETVTGWLDWLTTHEHELDLMMKPSVTDEELPVSASPKGKVVDMNDQTEGQGGDDGCGNGSPYRPPPMASLHQVL